MSGRWPEISLKEIANPVSRPVSVAPGQSYRTIGVKWWGEGAYERETIDGSQTAAKTLSVVRQGDLIINKIWVRHGSTAIVSPVVDGCAASGEFPTFQLDHERVVPEWIHWMTKTRSFWDKCDALSRGTSGKNRIKPELFLTISIPLPTVSEQRRVVALLGEAVKQVEEAQGLRRTALSEVEGLMAVKERELWPMHSLGDAPTLGSVTSFLARGRQAEQGESEHFLVKTQHVQQDRYVPTQLRLASHAAAKVAKDAVLRDGDVLIACSAAGCLGRVARYVDDGRIASADTHVAVVRADSTVINAGYLYAYLRGITGQYQLRSRERGDWQREKVGFRLTELNLSDLRQVPVPLPSKEEQQRIVAELDALQSEVQVLKRLQTETSKELDAMRSVILDSAFRGEL